MVFACSLEKNIQQKIREDLDAAAKLPVKVQRLFFFSDADVAVGRRHKLQEFAQATHGIALEIFDGRAISELLVDPEVFWIAQQYLSIQGRSDSWHSKRVGWSQSWADSPGSSRE